MKERRKEAKVELFVGQFAVQMGISDGDAKRSLTLE